jgi:hypothetical protein
MSHDTLAPVFAWGVFGYFALVGLVAGAALALAIGASIEWLLRRLRSGVVVAMLVASLVNVLAIWQATELVLHKYPGLRPAPEQQQQIGRGADARIPLDDRSYARPCDGPPPTDARQRAIWDSECR